MQIQMNNRSLPNLGLPLNGGAKENNHSDDSFEFQTMMKKDSPATTSPSLSSRKPVNQSQRDASGLDEDASNYGVETEEDVPTKTQNYSASKDGIKRGSKVKDSKADAVQKFMDSLESKLGISVERFSAVLAQLPPEIKSLPVEDSVPYIIQQLGVPESRQAEVTETYVSLMKTSGVLEQNNQQNQEPLLAVNEWQEPSAQELNQPKVAKTFVNEKSVNTETIQLTPRQKLNANIDEMNRKFFEAQAKPTAMRLPEKPPDLGDASDAVVASPQKKNLISVDGASLVDPNAFAQINPTPPSFEDKIRYAVESDVSSPSDMNYSLSPEMSQPYNDVNTISPTEIQVASRDPAMRSLYDLHQTVMNINPKLAVTSKDSLSTEASIPKQQSWTVEELPYLSPLEINGAKSAFNSEGMLDEQNEFSHQGQADLKGKGLEGLAKSKKPKDEKEDDVSQLLTDFNVHSERDSAKDLQRPGASQKIDSNTPALSLQDRVQNIQKLSNATEALSASGGGEVKVILSPEGLGSVQLKVRLQEGKVQVELRAENKESQKLLESSLGDLKNSLHAHHISLDSVKVDVGGEFTRREAHQEFNQPQMDLNREQAKQFMNQFREGNMFQKQSLFDAPGFQTYRAQRDEPLAPISQDIRPRSSLNVNKGRDLNLVA